MANNVVARFLSNFLSIAFLKNNKNKVNSNIEIQKIDKDSGRPKTVKFTPELQQLYNYWMQENFDSADTLKNRQERYLDLEYMYYNNTVVSKAVNLYASESTQADVQNNLLTVTAKNTKLEKYIKDFIKRVGINQNVLHSTAFDLALYGDHFWVVKYDQKGKNIERIVPTDTMNITDRLEFNPIEIEKKLKTKNLINLTSKNSRLQKLSKEILSKKLESDTSFFDTYLFGYQFGKENFLAPWNVLHFRRFTTKSEFYPFGRPLLINLVGPFRQLQSSKNLVALARAARFPKEHFSIKTDPDMSDTEKWDRVNEAREEYQNLGNEQSGKETFAIGGQIWTPDDLLDYKLIENRVDATNNDEVEYLRDDMIMGTNIPKSSLIVDQGSFGQSGVALLHQSKPFGRDVFTLQSAILEQIIYLIRLQLAVSQDFSYDEDFEISLSFPVIEESSDKMRNKSDSLRLVSDIISNMSTALGLDRGESIPSSVVKDIFTQYSFLNSEDIDLWVDKIQKQKEENTMSESVKKKIKERLTEDVVRHSYFQAKKNNLLFEGLENQRHFLNNIQVSCQEELILKFIRQETRQTSLKE